MQISSNGFFAARNLISFHVYILLKIIFENLTAQEPEINSCPELYQVLAASTFFKQKF
jgi:hypothetical protein